MSDRIKVGELNADYSEAEICDGALPPPRSLRLPINGSAVKSRAGDGFIIALADEKRIALLAVGSSIRGQCFHVRLSAEELRGAAGSLLRAADQLDGGRGKN
jgi:hypothetical protein